jgi:hypothetical protein
MKFHSKGRKVHSLVKRDLDIIKFAVEREFKISVRTKGHSRKEVDVKKVFISLVLNVYNNIQAELGSPNKVTLVALARYLRYTSHSSVLLHYYNSNKGYIAVEEYIMRYKDLRERYLRLKKEVKRGNSPTFRKFLVLKKNELVEELAVIEAYLNTKHEEIEEKEAY